MPHLSGKKLRILIPISWNASSGSLQLCASVAFPLIFTIIILLDLNLLSYLLHKLEGIALMLFFIHAFVGSDI